ncbi:hypothetical protein WME75_21790 [Sorangium sp. So ce1014]|uniref:hypothetical protein n=1 Tax=Sorangium sp. So ce1014 TaxID=3133326 RepID=UPI003F5F9954
MIFQPSNGSDIEEMEKQTRKLRTEISRLGEAIVATSEPPHALVAMMGERERNLAIVEAKVAALKTAPSVSRPGGPSP